VSARGANQRRAAPSCQIAQGGTLEHDLTRPHHTAKPRGQEGKARQGRKAGRQAGRASRASKANKQGQTAEGRGQAGKVTTEILQATSSPDCSVQQSSSWLPMPTASFIHSRTHRRPAFPFLNARCNDHWQRWWNRPLRARSLGNSALPIEQSTRNFAFLALPCFPIHPPSHLTSQISATLSRMW
jgi:hypothetical protein